MRKNRPPLRPNCPGTRLTAALVVFIFTLTNLLVAPSPTQAANAASPETPLHKESLNHFKLPKHFGKIEEIFLAPGKKSADDKIIFLIQDAHAIPVAQESLRSIIDFLTANHHIPLVALEGAVGKLDPTLLRHFPDKTILEKVLQEHVRQGELSGVSAAAILSHASADYQGIEDKDLYEKEINSFLKAAAAQPLQIKKLQTLRKKLEHLKEKSYSPELLRLDRTIQKSNSKNADWLGLLNLLQTYADVPHPSLSLGERVRVRVKYPHLAALFSEMRGQNTDAAFVAREIRSLTKFIGARGLSRREAESFESASQAYRTGKISDGTFIHLLIKLCRSKKIRPQISETLKKRAKQYRMLQKIQGVKLFWEIRSCAEEIKAKLFRNENEKSLDRISHQWDLIHRLTRLELTRAEWSEIKTIDYRPQTADQKTIKEKSLWSAVSGLSSVYFAFYETAEAREKVFAKNLNAAMKKEKTKVAALVTGGFHTAGLKEVFRKEGISYVLITPDIRSVPEETHYLDYMRGNVSWQKYFEVKNGRIDLYKAFHKAIIEKLLGMSHESWVLSKKHKDFDSRLKTEDPRLLLKTWRDEIIQALASEGRIAEFAAYANFLGASEKPAAPKMESLRKEWLEKVKRFSAGLRTLKIENRLTTENIMRLANQPTATPWNANPLERWTVPASWRNPATFEERDSVPQSVIDQISRELGDIEKDLGRTLKRSDARGLDQSQEPKRSTSGSVGNQRREARKVNVGHFWTRWYHRIRRAFFNFLAPLIGVIIMPVAFVFYILKVRKYVEFEGAENIPNNPHYVIVATHVSRVDGLIMTFEWILRKWKLIKFVAKTRHLEWLQKALVAAGFAIGARPGQTRIKLIKSIKHGNITAIFGKGVVTSYARTLLNGWNPAFAEVAVVTKRDVLPVSVSGVINPLYAWVGFEVKPFQLKIKVGKPISTEGKDPSHVMAGVLEAESALLTGEILRTTSFQPEMAADEIQKWRESSQTYVAVRSEARALRPSASRAGSGFYNISIPNRWFTDVVRQRLMSDKMRWPRFAKAFDVPGPIADRVGRQITRESGAWQFGFRWYNGKLEINISGWEKAWGDVWGRVAAQTLQPTERLRERYLQIQMLPIQSTQRAEILQEIRRMFVSARNADYNKDGRAPPVIQKIEILFGNETVPGYLIMPSHFSGTLPLTILLHGMTQTKEMPYFDSLEKHLVSPITGEPAWNRPSAILRIDLPRHGENNGYALQRSDLSHFIAAIYKHFQQAAYPGIDISRMGIVGHSFGGYTALQAIIDPETSPLLKAVVAVSPPIHDSFLQLGLFLYRYQEFFQHLLGTNDLDQIANVMAGFRFPLFERKLAQTPEDPGRLFIFIGERDSLIPHTDLNILRRTFKDHPGVVRAFRGEGHYIVERKRRAFLEIQQHLLDRYAPEQAVVRSEARRAKASALKDLEGLESLTKLQDLNTQVANGHQAGPDGTSYESLRLSTYIPTLRNLLYEISGNLLSELPRQWEISRHMANILGEPHLVHDHRDVLYPILQHIDEVRGWDQLSRSNELLREIYNWLKDVQTYMNRTKTWVTENTPELQQPTIAYFSAEYGIHSPDPVIYSGGLGVLSGDHFRGAGDLGLNFVGVGLLYDEGYFRQEIHQDGTQSEIWKSMDKETLPIEEVKWPGTDQNMILTIPFPNKNKFIKAKVWRMYVGGTPLILLNTNLEENSLADREITKNLYRNENGTWDRLEQYYVLGVGGRMALKALGLDPKVLHGNDGHPFLAVVENIAQLMESMKPDIADPQERFEVAFDQTRAKTVFTTHTPVAAGNEVTDVETLRPFLMMILDNDEYAVNRLLSIGTVRNKEGERKFNLTAFSQRMAGHVNAVSELHGRVAQGMWKGLYPGISAAEVPITGIVNSVHTGHGQPTGGYWQTKGMTELFATTFANPEVDKVVRSENPDLLRKKVSDPDWIDQNVDVKDEDLWALHVQQKRALFDSAKRRFLRRLGKYPDDRDLDKLEAGDRQYLDYLDSFDADALTIGFARRFISYKRALLLLDDLKRLEEVAATAKKPIQIVFAGKAHPRDQKGKKIIRDLHERIRQIQEKTGSNIKVIFIPEYNIGLAKRLEAGVDVWLNNPIRPHEASGTSGMKVAINGGLNLSTLDGWGPEGIYHGVNGWLGGVKGTRQDDLADREALFDILENEVIPTYDQPGRKNWIRMMKAAVVSTSYKFGMERMLGTYAKKMYRPAVQDGRGATLYKILSLAKTVIKRRDELLAAFRGADRPVITIEKKSREAWNREAVPVNALIDLKGLRPEEIGVDLLVRRVNGEEQEWTVVGMSSSAEPMGNGRYRFTANASFEETGEYEYKIRLTPRDQLSWRSSDEVDAVTIEKTGSGLHVHDRKLVEFRAHADQPEKGMLFAIRVPEDVHAQEVHWTSERTNWEADGVPMKKIAPDLWAVVIDPEKAPPGYYEFRFEVHLKGDRRTLLTGSYEKKSRTPHENAVLHIHSADPLFDRNLAANLLQVDEISKQRDPKTGLLELLLRDVPTEIQIDLNIPTAGDYARAVVSASLPEAAITDRRFWDFYIHLGYSIDGRWAESDTVPMQVEYKEGRLVLRGEFDYKNNGRALEYRLVAAPHGTKVLNTPIQEWDSKVIWSGENGSNHAFVEKRSEARIAKTANPEWWQDTSQKYIGVSYPISSSRRRKNDPGIGKYTDMEGMYERLAKRGVNVMLLLPHFATIGESPYEPIHLRALNEDYIDWAAVEEVIGDSGFADDLVAPIEEQKQIHLDSVRARERRVADRAYAKFKALTTGPRRQAYEQWLAANAWVQDYAEMMVLYEIIGRPPLGRGIEPDWTSDEIERAKRDSRYEDSVGRHIYAQFNAYAQFGAAVKNIRQRGGKILFDIPAGRSKRFIYPQANEKYYRGLRDPNDFPGLFIKNENTGAVYANQKWWGLASYDWKALADEDYRHLLDDVDHWLQFGLNGARVDAGHFYYDFSERDEHGTVKQKLGRGGEEHAGDKFVDKLAEVFKRHKALGVVEAFEGKDGNYRSRGFLSIKVNQSAAGDWEQNTGHDDPRIFHSASEFTGQFFWRLLSREPGQSAVFGSFPIGALEGDTVRIKEVEFQNGDEISHWTYRIPLEEDPDYLNRVEYGAGPYFEHRTNALKAAQQGNVLAAEDSVTALLAYDADRYVQPQADGSIKIAASHRDGVLSTTDKLTALPGLLLSTGRFHEAKAVLQQLADFETFGLIPNYIGKTDQESLAIVRRVLEERNAVMRERVEKLKDREANAQALGELEGKLKGFDDELSKHGFRYDKPYQDSMLFIQAVEQYAQYTGDWEFVEKLRPVLQSIIENFSQPKGSETVLYYLGQYYGIYRDEDGLIAKPVNDPRNPRAKAVDVNAFWYSNLRFMETVENKFGGQDSKEAAYRQWADQAKKSFNEKFWNEEEQALFDVVERPEGYAGASIRHYQIFAVSHGKDLLSKARQEKVLAVVEHDLLTPYGLRTLSPRDDHYNGTKHAFYDQGTVRPWLIEPYVIALSKVRAAQGKSAAQIANEVRPLITTLVQYFVQNPARSIDEAFEGGTRRKILRARALRAQLLRLEPLTNVRDTFAPSIAAVVAVLERSGIVTRDHFNQWTQTVERPYRVEVDSDILARDGKHHVRARVYVPEGMKPEQLTVQIWTGRLERDHEGKEQWKEPYSVNMRLVSADKQGGPFYVYEGEVTEHPWPQEMRVRAATNVGSDKWYWDWQWSEGGNVRLESQNALWRSDSPEGMYGRAANRFVRYLRNDNNTAVKGGVPELWAADWDWFFEEWGRDAFISLVGLLLTTGRYDEAKRVIHNFARYESGGLIPNKIWDPWKAEKPETHALLAERRTVVADREALFSRLKTVPEWDQNLKQQLQTEIGQKSERMKAIDQELPGHGLDYNNADAPMWFVHAIQEFEAYYQADHPENTNFIDQFYNERFADGRNLLDILRSIADHQSKSKDEVVTAYHHRGEYHLIYMDEDGLIVSPKQATWMDAWPGAAAEPITPRSGKAVEVNAMFYAHLRFLQGLEERFGDPSKAAKYREQADRFKNSFNLKFRNPEYKTHPGAAPLFDVVDGDPHKAALRPNMIFAVSHGGDLLDWNARGLRAEDPRRETLDFDARKAVVDSATQFLLTPWGMRTLAPQDSHYAGDYRRRQNTGDQLWKDLAYHQGTVWPWLIGSYVDAYVQVYGQNRDPLATILWPLLDYPRQSEAQSLPEVFDGDKSYDKDGLPIHLGGGTRSQAWSIAEVMRVAVKYELLDRRAVMHWNQSVIRPYRVALDAESVKSAKMVVGESQNVEVTARVYVADAIPANDLQVDLWLPPNAVGNWNEQWQGHAVPMTAGERNADGSYTFKGKIAAQSLPKGKYPWTIRAGRKESGDWKWLESGNAQLEIADPPSPNGVVWNVAPHINVPAILKAGQRFHHTETIRFQVKAPAEMNPADMEVELWISPALQQWGNAWPEGRTNIPVANGENKDGKFLYQGNIQTATLEPGLYELAAVARRRGETAWKGTGRNLQLEIKASVASEAIPRPTLVRQSHPGETFVTWQGQSYTVSARVYVSNDVEPEFLDTQIIGDWGNWTEGGIPMSPEGRGTDERGSYIRYSGVVPADIMTPGHHYMKARSVRIGMTDWEWAPDPNIHVLVQAASSRPDPRIRFGEPARSEVRRVVAHTLKTWASTGQILETEAGRIAEFVRNGVDPVALAVEQLAPSFAGVYAQRMGGDGASIVNNFVNYESHYSRFINESPADLESRIRTFLTENGNSKVHFAWAMPYDASLKNWLSNFIDKIQGLNHSPEFANRVSAQIVLLASPDDLLMSRDFLGRMKQTQMVQVVNVSKARETNTVLNTFLMLNENALIYGLPESFERGVAKIHPDRVVNFSGITWKEAFPLATHVNWITATVPSITPTVLQRIPDNFPPGMAGYNGSRLEFYETAREFVLRAEASRYVEQMA